MPLVRVFKKKTYRGGPKYGQGVKRRRAMAVAIARAPRPVAAARILNPTSQAPQMRLGEKKTIDIPTNDYPLSTTAVIRLLNGIQTGSGSFNRVGRKVNLENIYLTGFLRNTGTAGSVEDYGRVMVVYDRQPTGALPVLSDILQDLDQTGAATNTAMSGLNLNNKERFAVVMDERIFLPATTNVTPFGDPTASNYNFKRFCKLNGLNTEFKSTANPATIADIASGALYILSASAFIASGSEPCKLTLDIRLNYRDL